MISKEQKKVINEIKDCLFEKVFEFDYFKVENFSKFIAVKIKLLHGNMTEFVITKNGSIHLNNYADIESDELFKTVSAEELKKIIIKENIK